MQHFEQRTREERKTLAIIIKAVQTAAFKVILIIQEIIRYALMLQSEQAAILIPPANRHVKIGFILQLFTVLLLHVSVQRHYHPALGVFAAQGTGQAARDIA